MFVKIGFLFFLTIALFGAIIRANDCYSCKSPIGDGTAIWFNNVEKTLRRLDRAPMETTKDCNDTSATLPKVYCRSKCVKESLTKSNINYVARYCLDATRKLVPRLAPVATKDEHDLRYLRDSETSVDVNIGMGDRRVEDCSKIDREEGEICICSGHLCNGGLRTKNSVSFTLVIIVFMFVFRAIL